MLQMANSALAIDTPCDLHFLNIAFVTSLSKGTVGTTVCLTSTDLRGNA